MSRLVNIFKIIDSVHFTAFIYNLKCFERKEKSILTVIHVNDILLVYSYSSLDTISVRDVSDRVSYIGNPKHRVVQ